jgi:hypothetical protein
VTAATAAGAVDVTTWIIVASSVLGVFLAGAAAFYARRNDRFSRSMVQPHIAVKWQGAPANGMNIIVDNGGGQSPRLWWVGHEGTEIFVVPHAVVPAQIHHVLRPVQLVGNVAYPNDRGLSTTVCIAEDAQGRLWDCIDRKRVKGKAEPHVRARLEKVGVLPDDRDRVIDWLAL